MERATERGSLQTGVARRAPAGRAVRDEREPHGARSMNGRSMIGSLGVLGVLACSAACTDEVSLGAFARSSEPAVVTPPAETALPTGSTPSSRTEAGAPEPSATALPPEAGPPEPDPPIEAGSEDVDAGGADAGEAGPMDAGGERDVPGCLEPLMPGPFNVGGARIAATETSTDWTWPAPVESMSWPLMIEREPPAPSASQPANQGYYWVNQFSFVQGVAGRLGLQYAGLYSSEPAEIPTRTKMAVFWLSGPPLEAELGDIPFPDARVAADTAAGANWLTIHARFDWQVCRLYLLEFGPEASDREDTVWYAARIRDTTTGQDTLLGRMLLPADTGLLSPFSISSTSPFEFGALDACDAVSPVSALIGTPSTIDGSIEPMLSSNRFANPGSCATSRFAESRFGVRHELGVSE